MTKSAPSGFLLWLLAVGLAGCDSRGPTSPTSVAQQTVRPAAGPPPGLHGVTLFGIVFETTAVGQVAVADVSIYCDACGQSGHTWLRTDANGYYSFSGDLAAGGGIWLSAGPILVWVAKEGFQDPLGVLPGRREVRINGDTRFDIELVRP
jgi:hypothetical protein